MFSFFFFNDTATTEIYTLSLHDALPISAAAQPRVCVSRRRDAREARRGAREAVAVDRSWAAGADARGLVAREAAGDRKSTRLNSSHGYISYAVFCLKKKKTDSTLYSTSV